MKNVCDMKNFGTFAAFMTKNILLGFCLCGCFFAAYSAIDAANIGYQPLVNCCASEAGNCSWSNNGGDSLFYCNTLIFHSQMTKNVKNQSTAKHSTCTSRAACESGISTATFSLQVSNPYGTVCFSDMTAEMQRRFDVEKNAKNQAYAFILYRGLLARFGEFCRSNHSDDWHDTCLRILELSVADEN